jgi:hypothetical protein
LQKFEIRILVNVLGIKKNLWKNAREIQELASKLRTEAHRCGPQKIHADSSQAACRLFQEVHFVALNCGSLFESPASVLNQLLGLLRLFYDFFLIKDIQN